jgi:hypothetical protein
VTPRQGRLRFFRHVERRGGCLSNSGVSIFSFGVAGLLVLEHITGNRWPAAISKAEAMNFVPGADWSERGAGTLDFKRG